MGISLDWNAIEEGERSSPACGTRPSEHRGPAHRCPGYRALSAAGPGGSGERGGDAILLIAETGIGLYIFFPKKLFIF